MSASRQLLAAARRAMAARRDWNDAQIALQAKDLNEVLRERALERVRQQFHAANDFLASIVCQEFNIDAFGNELELLQMSRMRPRAGNTLRLVERTFTGIRITQSFGVGPSQPGARAPSISPLVLVQARVRRARAAYQLVDDDDVDAVLAARSAYLAALIEYFDVHERAIHPGCEAAE